MDTNPAYETATPIKMDTNPAYAVITFGIANAYSYVFTGNLIAMYMCVAEHKI